MENIAELVAKTLGAKFEEMETRLELRLRIMFCREAAHDMLTRLKALDPDRIAAYQSAIDSLK